MNVQKPKPVRRADNFLGRCNFFSCLMREAVVDFKCESCTVQCQKPQGNGRVRSVRKAEHLYVL